MHAVVVSTQEETLIGGVYVALLSAYPFMLGTNLSKTQSKRVFAATGPAYLIVFYFLGSTAVAALRS